MVTIQGGSKSNKKKTCGTCVSCDFYSPLECNLNVNTEIHWGRMHPHQTLTGTIYNMKNYKEMHKCPTA